MGNQIIDDIKITVTTIEREKGANTPLGNGHSLYTQHCPELIEYIVEFGAIKIELKSYESLNENSLFEAIRSIVNSRLNTNPTQQP